MLFYFNFGHKLFFYFCHITKKKKKNYTFLNNINHDLFINRNNNAKYVYTIYTM